jgi:hypothetical protein
VKNLKIPQKPIFDKFLDKNFKPMVRFFFLKRYFGPNGYG